MIDGRCADITGVQVAPISAKGLIHHTTHKRGQNREAADRKQKGKLLQPSFTRA